MSLPFLRRLRCLSWPFLAVAAACAGPAPAPPPPPARPPNLVFFLADDQRADAMSCAGHPFVQTPHLDRLAREGVRFRNAYVTTSLCAPSRACFLTGLYTHAHGVKFNDKDVVPPDIPVFPQLLRKAGYETVWIGKWHMPDSGRRRDFDRYFGFQRQGVYLNPKIAEGGRNVIGPDLVREGYMDDLLTDEAVRFLKSPHDRPFALLLWFKGVHGPWDPPERRKDLYRDVTIAEHPTFHTPIADGRPPALAGIDMKLERDKNTTPWRDFMRRYYAMVTGVDDNIGRVLAALDETGLARDTMVVHSSDNGFFMGEYGLYDKRLMYEPSIRVPLIVRWPGRAPAGRVVDAPALNVDLAPTFLEAAGTPVPANLHGRSLVPILAGETPTDWRKRWYYEYDEYPVAHRVRPHRGVKVDERWKYIRWITEPAGEELYDVAADPDETRNLAGDPAHHPVLERMRTEFEAAKQEVGDSTSCAPLDRLTLQVRGDGGIAIGDVVYPDAAHDSLRAYLERRAACWPDPDHTPLSGLHITLAAPGTTPFERVQSILQLLGAASVRVYKVEIDARKESPGNR